MEQSPLESFLSGNPIRQTRRFMITAFAIGATLGLTGSILFYAMKPDILWATIIFFALGFTAPMASITVRALYVSLVLGTYALEEYRSMRGQFERAQAKIEPLLHKFDGVVDKVPPMIENVSVVVEKAKNMSDDIVVIANRVAVATQELNGSFNVKVVEKKLDELAKSLSTIAGAFAVSDQEPTIVPLEEFDPTKMGPRRKRQDSRSYLDRNAVDLVAEDVLDAGDERLLHE